MLTIDAQLKIPELDIFVYVPSALLARARLACKGPLPDNACVSLLGRIGAHLGEDDAKKAGMPRVFRQEGIAVHPGYVQLSGTAESPCATATALLVPFWSKSPEVPLGPQLHTRDSNPAPLYMVVR